MKLPALRRKADPEPLTEAPPVVPPEVRTVGWMWLAVAPIGFVSGLVEFFQSLQSGGLSVALPIGIGMSGWSIGRGLLKGNRRAWRWARRLAAFTALASTAGALAACVAWILGTGGMEITSALGNTPTEPWVVMLLFVAFAIVGGWQYRSLSSAAARSVFDLPKENGS